MGSKKNKTLLTVAVVSLVLIAFSLSFGNLSNLSSLIGDFLYIISSVLFGMVFAYLMNPVMSFVEKHLGKLLRKRNLTERTVRRLSRGVGIVTSILVFAFAIWALFMLVFPQLIESIEKLVSPENLSSVEKKLDGWITNIVSGTRLEAPYRENAANMFDSVQRWLTETLLNESTLLDVAQWAVSAVNLVINVLLGVIVAIYILIYKDTFRAQAKKLVVSMFKRERANRILELAKASNQLFSGFLLGKMIDSIIVGLLCYICMLIMQMPYAALISVIVGVTNMIPFFGPFIGAIPSAFIILVEDPLMCFYFLIFVFVLQQIDGNIIGPRILGETVGMSDFWVLVSITLFGGLFGVTGMILGVPVFGVIYRFISDAVNRSLEKKKEPTETKLYRDISMVDDLHPASVPPEVEESFFPSYDTEFDPDDDFFTDDSDDFDI